MNEPVQFVGRSATAKDTGKDSGVVVAYPDRSYADQKALTLLNQLRQHLPNADYREALPAQIMNCCTELRRRGSFDQTRRLEMIGTFDLDDQSIRFRVLSLSPKQPSDAAPVLVLLDLISE
jgi:hypothetical protein